MNEKLLFLLFFSVLLISCTTTTTTTTTANTTTVQQENLSCETLQQNLDLWNTPSIIDCDSYRKSNETRLVGGTVIRAENKYDEAYQYYEEHYTIKGLNKQKRVYGISQENVSHLEIGKFYEFDLMTLCGTITSMAHSGSMSITAFKERSECLK